jgi:hypothetical protein
VAWAAIEGSEGRSEGTANVDGWVSVRNGFEKVWTGQAGVGGLPVLDFDIGDSKLLEKV